MKKKVKPEYQKVITKSQAGVEHIHYVRNKVANPVGFNRKAWRRYRAIKKRRPRAKMLKHREDILDEQKKAHREAINNKQRKAHARALKRKKDEKNKK